MPKAIPPDLQASRGSGRALARRYPRGLYIEPHAHDWAQVLYAVAGVMWVEAGDEALMVPPQRAVWLPAGTVHAIRMLSAVEMRNVYLRSAYVQHLSNRCDVFEVNGLLRELISAIAEHEQDRDDTYLDAAFRMIVLELEHAPRHALRIPLPGAHADRRLAALCEAVIANPSIDVSFEQHAAHTGASVRTLARLFMRELGVGFAEWRRQVQLAVAVSRLAEGQPVGSVARSLGYLPGSFSDMFRRELGAPPTGFYTRATLATEAPSDSGGVSGAASASDGPSRADAPAD